MVLAAAAVVAMASPIRLYVSERGDDAARGTEGRPFRTPERAVRALAELRAGGDLRPAVVALRGRFTLTEPLRLGAESLNTTYESWGKNRGVLSGGTEIARGWREVAPGLWEAAVPEGLSPRQLWVGDVRRPLARLPKQGFYQFESVPQSPWNEGQATATFRPGQMPADAVGAEVVVHHYWILSRMGIRTIDAATRAVDFDRKSVFRLTDDYQNGGAFYRLENLPSALTEPGEWIFDARRRVLRYRPVRGERIVGFRATVGRLPVLVRAEGARGLRLRELDFAHSDWAYPSDRAGDPQAAVSVPGAIQLHDDAGSVLERCRVRNAGTYAVEVTGASAGTRILRNEFTDLGGGGVKLGPGSRASVVSHNVMERLGRVHMPAVGVWIGDSGDNVVTHNRIHDLYYTGISVGWVWGYGPSNGARNRIEANDISKVGQGELSDMGGIYTLGVSPGTVIRRNRIQNIEARGYGGWGIYLDEGSTHILVEENLVMDTKTGGFHQHYGRDNVIRNNVFLRARTEGQVIRTRLEDHTSFTFERNVVEWAGTPLFAGNWSEPRAGFENNLFWRTDTPADRPAWLPGSNLFADPQIRVSPTRVTFGPEARSLGITPLDLRNVGP